jgi:hypothetical protein
VSIDEVANTVERGNHAAQHAQATAAATGDRIAAAHRLAGITHGSEHDQVKLGHARLAEAATEARRVFDLLRSGAHAAEEFRRALG